MRIRAAAAASLAIVAMLALPRVAQAHEEADIGPFHLAVGFADEPAYAGQPNAVQMYLDKRGKAVTDLTNELQVTVTFGDQTSDPITFAPFFEIGESGTPGDYRAFFVPSQPGSYTFHVTGTFQGQAFDHSFTSGPKTFSDVQTLETASFPRVTAPSNADLAARIEQDSARTSTSVGEASDSASSAKTFGLIGVVVGLLGLVAGGAALTKAGKD